MHPERPSGVEGPLLHPMKGICLPRVHFTRVPELLFYGFAVGAKNPIGRSREVRNPAGELRIAGMEFTATLAVAMSPCEPPGIVNEIFG